MATKVKILLLFLCCAIVVGAASSEGPDGLKAERVSYSKITLSWKNSQPEQISHYLIFRNTHVIGQSPNSSFIDEGLSPNTSYNYQVQSVTVGGSASELTPVLAVRTLKPGIFEEHAVTEQAVNTLHGISTDGLSALMLFNAVKSALESITGSNVIFSVLNSNLVTMVLAEELTEVRGNGEVLSDAEQAALQTSLNGFLTDRFQGCSFDEVYMHAMLAKLAERHWMAGEPAAATALYEFALNYMRNNEAAVQNSLLRMAGYKRAELNAGSSTEDIARILLTCQEYCLRFFDFFPDSGSRLAQQAYIIPANWYFLHFPQMLPYENYNQAFYAQAKSLADKATELGSATWNAEHNQKRISAWELLNWPIRLQDQNGNSRQVTLTVTNVSNREGRAYVYPGTIPLDERQFKLNGTGFIPIYAGHVYQIQASIEVPGGAPLQATLPLISDVKGKNVTFDPYRGTLEAVSGSGTPGLAVNIPESNFPYNLRFERNIDVFTLAWDWVSPANFTLKEFKVFNGNQLITTVSGCHAARIPLSPSSGNYQYSVIAYDVNGNASNRSAAITVLSGDQSAYADFFSWLKRYFQPGSTLSCDDPDGDGIDNYHEFLNGTDPTKVPAPRPYLVQSTYHKLTLKWEVPSTLPQGASWLVKRDGVDVATVTSPEFTDSGLSAGTSYSYQVRYCNTFGSSDWSKSVQSRTLQPITGAYAPQLQQAVDRLNPVLLKNESTISFLHAVKSSIEALFSLNITTSVIDQVLLSRLVEQEKILLNDLEMETDPVALASQYSALQETQTRYFAGNSFENSYIAAKMSDLAEMHWREFLQSPSQTAKRQAAEQLFEAALEFMPNQRNFVLTTLIRWAQLQDQSPMPEEQLQPDGARALLRAQRNIIMRYFQYFDAAGTPATLPHPYFYLAQQAFKKFPQVLTYDGYDLEMFSFVRQAIQDLANRNPELQIGMLKDKINAWRLNELRLGIQGDASLRGSLQIENVSGEMADSVFPHGAKGESRTLEIAPGSQALPVYAGHDYRITLVTPVAGGNDWIRTLAPLKFPAGRKVVYSVADGIAIQDLPLESTWAEFHYVLEQPQFPYNLRAEKLPDVFTLRWDWVAPAGFELDHFEVFRGTELLGTCVTTYLNHLARNVNSDGSYGYTVVGVAADGRRTARSETLQILPDFTPEEQRYFAWKQQYFGDTPTLATDDYDNDGLSNYQEFLLGSNPLVAPPQSSEGLVADRLNGVQIAYYETSASTFPDFVSLTPFKEEVISQFSFSRRTGSVLNSGRAERVGFIVNGFFDVPADGKYTFFMNNDDGCRLLVDEVAVIENTQLNSTREQAKSIRLKKGIHSFRVEYFQYDKNIWLEIFWAGEDGARKRFDDGALFHVETASAELKEYLIAQRDTDGDGLSDAEEMRQGTDWTKVDSDGDGLSDYDEIHLYHTNPNAVDSNGNGISDGDEVALLGKNDGDIDLSLLSFERYQTVAGKDYAAALDQWKISGDHAVSQGRRGALEYNIALTQGNICKLEFDLAGFWGNPEGTDVDVYVDGLPVGTTRIFLANGDARTLTALTPFLASGSHRVRLVWDNYYSGSSIAVRELRLFGVKARVLGTSDSVGLAEMILARRNNVNVATTARTSPYCLTGTASYPTLTKVNNMNATPSGADSWFVNVPLSATAAVTVAVSHENGGYVRNQEISWQATNVVTENGMTLQIRKGDSLLLTAGVEGASQWTVAAAGIALSGSGTEAQAQQFNESGTVVLTGRCTGADGAVTEGTVTVEVLEYAFRRPDVACWTAWGREWEIAPLPTGARLQLDQRYLATYQKSENGKSLLGIFIDDNKERYNVVRIGDDGPILAAQKVSGIAIYSSNLTSMALVESDEEAGVDIYEMTIVGSPVRSDVKIHMNIFMAGILFDDGTVSKVLQSGSFDASGICKVRFVRAREAETSVCHNLTAYQNGELIGKRAR